LLDNDIYKNIKKVLDDGFAALGMTGIIVKQRYQPTKQGTPIQNMVTFFKLPNVLVGSPQASDEWDHVNSIMVNKQIQAIETTLQIGAQVLIDPAKPSPFTASDLVTSAAMILQSQDTITKFVALGLGVQKIRGIRNPYFLDDRDQFEADPSFDFTVSHEQVIIRSSPVVQTETFDLYRI